MSTKFGELFDESIRFFFSKCHTPKEPLPRLVALVGVKGSGKTSTAMKLAYSLRTQGRKVAVVNLDTDDKHANEMFEVFSAESGIPYTKVGQARGFAKLIKKFDHFDHVIFDTPSVSRHEKGSVKKLLQKLETFGTANFAVYSGRESEYLEVMGFSGELAIEGLLFTQLDHSRRPGYFYNMMEETGLPAHYFGIGERVPSGFEVATPERLVALLFKMDDSSESSEAGGGDS